jgi:RNA polymerase sigma factor (sigma-70 family)
VPSNRNRVAPLGLRTLFHTGSLTGLTDGQLLERFALQDGEEAESAFATLVARHGAMVWCTCLAALRDDHDAGDAFQAAFLVLARKARSLWVRDSLGPWLHRVALRAALGAKREANRRKEAEQRVAELTMGWTDCDMPDDLADIIHQEIDRLPERQRVPVVLCLVEERSHEEAARHLRCPVGTVKSRLARARQRLQAALCRRGVGLAALQPALIRNLLLSPGRPPQVLTASTTRSAVVFATDPVQAANEVSKTAFTVAEGVLRVMIRSKLQSAVVGAVAALGLLIMAWLAHAGQAVVDRANVVAPAAAPNCAVRAADLEGNWIVRGYPSGEAIGLFKIEGPPRRAHANLLSITRPDWYHFAESKVDQLRIDEKTVRFKLQLKAGRPVDGRSFDVIVYLPKDDARPHAAWGSMGITYGQRIFAAFPAKIERTQGNSLEPKEGQAPGSWNDDLRRLNQTKDRAKRKEMLEGMQAKYRDTPMAPLAAWVLAIDQAEAHAPEAEVRGLIDQAARVAAHYGRELELEASNVIIRNIVGMEELENLTLEYARKAVAMLQPSDSVALQIPALKNLASALRKARKIDQSKATAEANSIEDRIAKLSPPARDKPARVDLAKPGVKRDQIPWSRNLAAARKEAREKGKLILVDFYTESCGWCKRLDSEVFPQLAVSEAISQFVPVKVDAEDGEGRPLVEKYQAHIQGYPAMLFLDPAIEDPQDGRIVGKIPGFLPPSSFVEQLNAIAHLPRDIGELRKRHKANPHDMDVLRQLVIVLAIQGRSKEAIELARGAKDASGDPNVDRWAFVFNTLGHEIMWRQGLSEAALLFKKAARIAKRPIDVYNARLGAGFVGMLERRGNLAARELEAAARVAEVPSSEREFAKELLGSLVKPTDGTASVQEGSAELERPDAGGAKAPGDQPPSTKGGASSAPK